MTTLHARIVEILREPYLHDSRSAERLATRIVHCAMRALPEATSVRPLLVKIRGLTQQPRDTIWCPHAKCDCNYCMRFLAIRKLATVGIDHIDGKKPTRKRAKKGKR